MALATFLQLVVDARDPARLGTFWSTVLGWEARDRYGGTAVQVTGPDPADALWVQRVPEPRTVKNRVHLDLDVGSLEPLVAAGARVVLPAADSGFSWTQMADPEGGEFCAFVRDHLDPDAPASIYEVGVDVADSATSQAAAEWWADVLGGSAEDDGRDFWWVADVDPLPFQTIDMAPVPEPKTVKNRVHWDVTCDDVPALVARGATILAEPDGDRHWHVLADPWGNEFCAFGS